MKKKVLTCILGLIFIFFSQGLIHAYSTGVHEAIARTGIDQMIGNLDNYINDYTGLKNGVREIINKKRIRLWIEAGSREEDYIISDALLTGHYHNPYTNRGLTEGGITIGQSAYDRVDDPTNYWGWKKARQNFYDGLTSTERNWGDLLLANSFAALGHVMHLIQDMGVPAHTRDDIHTSEPYENYTSDKQRYLNYAMIPFPYRYVSISPNAPRQFWDLDSYNGSIPYDSGYIGLSEYTHANFLSKDTLFKYFPHPKPENTDYSNFGLLPFTIITTPDNVNHNTYYISGYGKQHLAALKYFAEELWSSPIPSPPKRYQLTVHLDNRCHEEYAQYLIPRTVGYSAGLLDYFFRGKLQVTTVPILYKNTISYLRVKIKNITPTQETMQAGELCLTYHYTPTGGNPDGSQDIWGKAPIVPSGILVYDGEETVIDFPIPEPIPVADYKSVKFILAFKGTLGNEVEAVIGKSLSLGEIKLAEEWDTGLNGNHNWAHTDFNLFGQNPDNGTTSNILEANTLVKDNVRRVGNMSARVNESFLSTRYNNGQFKDILPILVTPDTYVQFKIDEMWINQRTPAASGFTNDWQFLWLGFNNGLGIQYFTDTQGVNWGLRVGAFQFDPNFIVVNNIYELLQLANISIPTGDLYLEEISLIQQLSVLDNPVDVEYHQRMKIDSVWIIEGKTQ